MTTLSYSKRLLAIGLTALVLAGCAAPVQMAAPAAPVMRDQSSMLEMPAAAPKAGTVATEAPVAPAATGGVAQSQPAQPRLIIRTADLNIVVKNTREQLSIISKLASQYGGFVVSSGTSQMGSDLQGQITLRVEAKNFDLALAEIRKLAVDVRSENVRGEDVTGEYVDLDSQLKNLAAAEAQLQKIMEQATKTEDVLNVYQQLVQTRGQIDQIKGRMKFLSQSAALSTINVSLIPDASTKPVEVGGWRLEGVVKNAVESLIGLMQGLATLAINLVIVVLPVLVIFFLPVIGLLWAVRRIQKRRTVKVA